MYDTTPVVVRQSSDSTALTALLLGLATLVTFGATGIPAIIVGCLAIRKVSEGKSDALGMAVTGTVLGALATLGWTTFLALMFTPLLIGGIAAVVGA